MNKKALLSLISLLLAAVMLFSLGSCNNDQSDIENDTTAEDTTVFEETSDRYVYKHVVVVGIDGAGAFFEKTSTPNFDSIFENGAVTFDAITSTPSISAQSWGSLLTGVTPEFHGLDNGVTGTNAYPSDSQFPTIFRVVREQMPDAALASFCNWNNINIGIIEDDIDVYKGNLKYDADVIKAASNYVKTAQKRSVNIPTLMFLQLDEADGAGHGSDYGSPAHLETLTRLDSYLPQLYQAYVDAGVIEDTLFIVTTDHGGLNYSHGGASDVEMKIMFAAVGKTVVKGKIGEMGIRDTAAIVAYALGLEQPATWTARVPSGLFEGVEASERPVYVDPNNDRTHSTVATPTKDSDAYVTNFITDKELVHYLPFDGNADDMCGGQTSVVRKLYYIEDGYFGQSVSLVDGYASIESYAPGTDSFSVSLWLKTGGVSSDPALFSNKNWDYGGNPGYILSINSGSAVKFNLGNGSGRVDVEYKLPLDYKNNWIHMTLVVDREANEIRFAFDFGEFQTYTMGEEWRSVSFDAANVLNIGQDSTGNYAALSGEIDEFMIFDGALTEEDLASLAAYYGK